jgi:soluble lytic murein transglycosylase-like protein
MIELFIGCSLFLQTVITEQSIDDYFLCNHLQDVKQWYYKTEQHFGEDTLFALAVMSCESDGRAKATGYNTDGSIDQGLFQFNSKTEKWLEKDIYNKDLDMYDAETNIKAARWLSYYDGWHHWNSSKHCWGRYDTFSR